MLIGYAEDDPETQARLAAFRHGLETLGWTEGRKILIDYRFAPADPDQAQSFAKELVALRPDALVGNSTLATAALLHETRTIRSYSSACPTPWAAASSRVSRGWTVIPPGYQF
jgi:putative ABC transport system substrate-binding protein